MRGTVHWMVAESKPVEISIRLVGFSGGVGPVCGVPIDPVKNEVLDTE